MTQNKALYEKALPQGPFTLFGATISFLTERYPFQIFSIGKWLPFHMLHEGILQTLGTKLMNDMMGEYPN